MRLFAAATVVLMFAARSSSAGSYSTEFSFGMVTNSGVAYDFDSDQSHPLPIKLPGALVAAGWECQRQSVILTNSGSGYIGIISCTGSGVSLASSSVICNAKKAETDSARFDLGVDDSRGKLVSVEFRLSCITRLGTQTHTSG